MIVLALTVLFFTFGLAIGTCLGAALAFMIRDQEWRDHILRVFAEWQRK